MKYCCYAGCLVDFAWPNSCINLGQPLDPDVFSAQWPSHVATPVSSSNINAPPAQEAEYPKGDFFKHIPKHSKITSADICSL